MRKGKATRRNTNGRRNPTPPPFHFGPSVARLDAEMRGAELAMRVASHYAERFRRI